MNPENMAQKRSKKMLEMAMQGTLENGARRRLHFLDIEHFEDNEREIATIDTSLVEGVSKLAEDDCDVDEIICSQEHSLIISEQPGEIFIDLNNVSTATNSNVCATSLEPIPQDDNNFIKIPSTTSEVANKPKSREKRKQTNTSKNFMDFISDDENAGLDYEWDSSSWVLSSANDSDSDNARAKTKKVKRVLVQDGETVGERGLKKPRINKKIQRKRAKARGEEYVDKNGKNIPSKHMLDNPCFNKVCHNKCGEIHEDRRENLFKHFWKMDIQGRREWLVSMTKKEGIKRKRVKESDKRNYTFSYFINNGEGRRQVCQKFIINTLNISQKFLHYTVSNASEGFSKEDKRGKIVPANKTKEILIQALDKYIQNLPAVPSHYCRHDSVKLYLPQNFKNLSNLYILYKRDLTAKGMDVVGEQVFRNTFNNKYNIGFHVPKKDKCAKCLQFERDPGDETVILKTDHFKEVRFSDKRFKYHKQIHQTNDSILCTSFDLQKVLNTPYGESMLLYYSRKYAMYNLTFYESTTRRGFCYCWGEADGKRGGNEVSTILTKYIQLVDQRGTIKTLLLYSDSCPGQNKNRIVLATIHYILQNTCKNISTIQLNYLLPGHTNMPVDSMHAVIEGSTSKNIIWAPSQWSTVFELARKSPMPYGVEVLSHKDFVGWGAIADKYFRGNLTGKISRVRIATFKKSAPNKINLKYSMDPEIVNGEDILVEGTKTKIFNNLYKSRLPIPKAKYEDLVKLCHTHVIPQRYWAEFIDLSYNNEKEVLLESDIEDTGTNE